MAATCGLARAPVELPDRAPATAPMTASSLPARAGAPQVERLGPADLTDSFAFLDRDPVMNVYLVALLLRDALSRPRDEYWGARREGAGLVAFLHLGGHSGAILPLGEDDEALERLGECGRARLAHLPGRLQLVGPRGAVDAFLRSFARDGPTPRLERDQFYMELEPRRLPAVEPLDDLVPAVPADLSLVHDSGARLRLEELGEDPRLTDPAAYRRRAAEECRDRHTFLWKDGAALRFRASVSALTADAAQISGVYVPEPLRGRGFATRALAELCARLLARSRRVCLFVNRSNAPALRVYRKLGFVARADWRSLFYDLHATAGS